MKNRLKILRKSIGLNQKNFGERIGVTASAICNYENGSRTLTEQTIMAICREFNVNRSWFVEGTGDMFTALPQTLINKLALQFDLTEDEKKFIHDFCLLTKEHRKTVLSFMRGI